MFDFEDVFSFLSRIFMLIFLALGVVYFGFHTFCLIRDGFEYVPVCDSSCICSCCDTVDEVTPPAVAAE